MSHLVAFLSLHGAGPARLPGFHTCVGGGGDKHDKSWYEEKGGGTNA